MTSTTTPRHAAESDAPGSFQPFTDLRSGVHSHNVADPGHSHGMQWTSPTGTHEQRADFESYGAHAHPIFHPAGVSDPGNTHVPMMPASLSGLVGERFPEAANEHHCAGTLSPAAMTEAEFVASMERMRADWNAKIDALLDATAPGWRVERARQQAAAGQIASVAA